MPREIPDEVWAAIVDIVQNMDRCWFDHNGYCQEHYASPPCPYGVLRTYTKGDVP